MPRSTVQTQVLGASRLCSQLLTATQAESTSDYSYLNVDYKLNATVHR